MYVNQKYLSSIDWVMLEIKLPREIFKSPLATENAIVGFLQSSGASTWYARNYEGKLPHFGSLEIASIEGIIHFYIRVPRRYKLLFETNFYAQYPGIEIVEADDYTKLIRYHHLSKDVFLWGLGMKTGTIWKPRNPKNGEYYSKSGKSEPKDSEDELSMKADFFPIKTYVDYGLDKDPKEEFKVDPLTPLLEMMGSIGKGEHMWYQVLVQDEGVYDGKKMEKLYLNTTTHEHFSLKQMADMFKKQKRTSHYVKHGDVVMSEYGYEQKRKVEDGVDENGKPKTKEIDLTYNFKEKDRGLAKAVSKKEMDLTQEEKDELEAINKKLSKPLAAVVIRLVYVAKKENFNTEQIGTTVTYMRWFAGANKFVPSKITNPYDYPWEMMGGKRVAWRSEETFERYVEREGFFPHVKERKSLDKEEDRFFYPFSMKQRKLFRLIFEAIFYPFEHPQADEVSILNLEEIATLWHLPGATAGTPTLPRIDSNKGVAPANLPL